MSLLIRGATIVNADLSVRGDILIHDGVIRDIAPTISPSAAGETIDAGGCLVMPRVSIQTLISNIPLWEQQQQRIFSPGPVLQLQAERR
jgi:alpha-D-ribose 1-methylphosphonate 5-triphosphate diphosphatase PhnM